ncbi:MAG: hypothetical protein CL942_04235 [Desulfovibrio sp.]|nr:hypothetical protein [Desulfovibrio sp.]|tara:strand:+ start:113 stop:997 length:885 start_codon:yes stop_codon:yes gene_type:complete
MTYRDVIRLANLPEDEREEFEKFLFGRTCPVLEGEGLCAWPSDYSEFQAQYVPPRAADEARTVMIVGDVHASWGMLNKLINRQRPDIILQCGDFGFWPKNRRHNPTQNLKIGSTQLHWCDGNHEDHEALEQVQASGRLEIMPTCFYQPRGSMLELPDGRVVLFAGGGLSVDNGMRKPGHDWFPDHELLTEKDLAKFPDPAQVKIDIVISHTAPLEFDVEGIPYSQWPSWWDRTPDPSRRTLSEVLRRYKPSRWFFGHFHTYQKGKVDGCEWTTLSCVGSIYRWWEYLDDLHSDN